MTITEALATIDRELWDTPPEVNEAIALLRETLADRLKDEAQFFTYCLQDRVTRETVCVFQARTFDGTVATYRALDPDLRLHLSGLA